MRRLAAAAMRLELLQLGQHRLFVGMTVLAAASLLVLVSLFALTGSDAPLAVVDEDGGAYAQAFYAAMQDVPHAFTLSRRDDQTAHELLRHGRLIGVLTIPRDFEAHIRRGDTVPLDVEVDNLNQDLLFDLQRALPSAILSFGHKVNLPGLRVQLVERDLLPHDIPFLRYLAVSALGLCAFVIAAALAALAVAREWEDKTLKLMRLSPARLGAVLAGKLAASSAVATLAVLVAAGIVIAGYGVAPKMPLAALATLIGCVLLFASLGAWLGALFRRTLPIVPLVFGLAMPLFIDCGALEPTRFDGETLWRVAHASPLYYAVGVLEWAFFGVRVTPEPIALDVLVLLLLALFSVAAAIFVINRATARSRAWR